MKKHNLFLLSAVLLCSSQNAFAYDMGNGVWKNLNEKYEQTTNNKSLISGMLSDRIYYNNTYGSENKKNEYSDTFIKTRLGVNVKLSDNFSFKTTAKFEKVNETSEAARRNQLPNGGGNRSFENHGAWLDEAVLGYDYKKFSALAGKMSPNFGDAWKSSNGIWVNEFAKKNYEHKEKLGLGLIGRAGDKKTIGEYVFGFSTFTNDRKNFDNSSVTERDTVSKADGKVGDTRSLKSYVASMDVYYDFGKKEKLSYHGSYSNLAINERTAHDNAVPAKNNDQKSFAVNMNYDYPVCDKVLVSSFVEYVKINNLSGNIDKSSDILTANITTYVKDFYFTIARAQRRQKQINKVGVFEHINEVAVGYKFDNVNPVLKGLSLAAGYNQRETNPIADRAFGLMLNHKLEF